MTTMENPPSIRRIETDRDDAYAFEIVGHINAADVENIYGLLEGAYQLHEKIDLFVHVKDYEGFDWSTAFRKSTFTAKTHALKHIRRYALVGGPEWMTGAINLFKSFTSVDIRHFDDGEVTQAWAFVDAHPAAEKV